MHLQASTPLGAYDSPISMPPIWMELPCGLSTIQGDRILPCMRERRGSLTLELVLQAAAAVKAEPSDAGERPTYFGLDDSDIEEWLESSSNGSVHALAVAPQTPTAVKLLTASIFRGPRTSPSGDACRVVPPNR